MNLDLHSLASIDLVVLNTEIPLPEKVNQLLKNDF